MPQETKTVHFYRLAITAGRATVRAELVDWQARLAEHLQKDVAERLLAPPSGMRLVTEAVPSNPAQVILGKVLDKETGLHRGSIAGAFEVVEPRNADEFFFRVNYVQFISGTNAFALIGGAGDAPSSSAVEVLASHLAPPAPGQRWVAQALMSEAEIERFAKTGALKSVSFNVNVAPPDIFDSTAQPPAEGPPDLYTWGQAITSAIGASVTLRVNISLEDPAQHLDAGRRFRKVLDRSRDRLLPRARRVQAVPLGDDDEVINLLRYRLTAFVPLPEPEPRLTGEAFQAYVLDQLGTVSATMKDRIISATKG